MENNRMQRGNMAARNHRAMNKSTLHVRFEISFLNSYDMTMLREKYGIAGWGIAVFMMKYLIERRTGVLSFKVCKYSFYSIPSFHSFSILSFQFLN